MQLGRFSNMPRYHVTRAARVVLRVTNNQPLEYCSGRLAATSGELSRGRTVYLEASAPFLSFVTLRSVFKVATLGVLDTTRLLLLLPATLPFPALGMFATVRQVGRLVNWSQWHTL
jgi:hypothetical protein